MKIQAKVYHQSELKFLGEVFDRDNDVLVQVGREVFTDIDFPTPETPLVLAEQVFERWNIGSGVESEGFLRTRVRSFSVGDVVVFPELETSLICLSAGWGTITPNPDRMFDLVA